MECPNGHAVNESDAFCPQCGTSISAAAEGGDSPDDLPTAAGSTPTKRMAAGLLLALSAVAVSACGSGHPSRGAAASPPASSTTAETLDPTTQCRTELSAWTVYLARQGLNDTAETEWESRAGDTPVFGDVIDLATNLDSQSQTLGAAAASNEFAADLGIDCARILKDNPNYEFHQLGVPGGPTPASTATTSAPPTTTNSPSFPVTQPSEASQCPAGVPASLIETRYQGAKITVLATGCSGSYMQVFYTVNTQVQDEDFQDQSGTWTALSPPAGVGGATCDPFIPGASLSEIDKQTGYEQPAC